MKIDQRTKEVTLTEAEYYKLVNSPVSEDLEDAAMSYATNEYYKKSPSSLPQRCIGCYAPLIYAFKAGAKWQKEKHERQFSFINLKDCKDAYNEWKGTQKEPVSPALSWVRACRWQKQQDQSTIELAEDHAMLAGMEKMKEQMMKDAVDGIVYSQRKDMAIVRSNVIFPTDLKKGDKVKLIIIKED